MCHGPLWAKFKAEYGFWESQGAYGLQLTNAPPWFPVEVVVVMLVAFPTRLDPSAFCVVLVGVAMGPPTR